MSCPRSTALAMIAVGLACGTAVASPTNPKGTGSSLERVVLRPSQVGHGYVLKVIPGGRSVRGQVTLDMCGFHFDSESRRIARIQAVYLSRGTKLFLSNEVVKYRPGGAEAGMREIDQAIRTCPRKAVPSTIRGIPPLKYQLTRLSPRGQNLIPGAIVMRVIQSGTLKGKKFTETSFVTYQRVGDVLSGIYVYDGTLRGRRTMAFAASAQSARNLKRQR